MTRISSRRRFLAGAAASAGLAPLMLTSKTLAQTRTLYVNTWGGSWTAAEEAAFFKPFSAETGARVRTVSPVSYAKLKAQVQSGSYEWDVTAITAGEWLRAEREGLAEPIDWAIVKKDKLPPDTVFANGIHYCALGTNLCYRTDKFPNGGPKSWADFWDVKKFPGNRSLYNSWSRALPAALIADGVPLDKLYPLDVDRGFKKLGEIKPHIKVWWTQGNQSQQLIRDGEVDMMSIWNARGSELKAQGVPVEVVWAGATITMTTWGVAKNAPNKSLAWEFIQFAVQAAPQAEFCKRLYYGPTNPKAFEFIPQEAARQMPTYPANEKVAVRPDPVWEADNAAPLQERFTQWLAS
ncbi:MAG: ABC transporter substrate-binding protein [Proteobacteria bacterium]|nr:ABC transporter substrate-binding protein [Pseudomonadota bacterium]